MHTCTPVRVRSHLRAALELPHVAASKRGLHSNFWGRTGTRQWHEESVLRLHQAHQVQRIHIPPCCHSPRSFSSQGLLRTLAADRSVTMEQWGVQIFLHLAVTLWHVPCGTTPLQACYYYVPCSDSHAHNTHTRGEMLIVCACCFTPNTQVSAHTAYSCRRGRFPTHTYGHQHSHQHSPHTVCMAQAATIPENVGGGGGWGGESTPSHPSHKGLCTATACSPQSTHSISTLRGPWTSRCAHPRPHPHTSPSNKGGCGKPQNPCPYDQPGVQGTWRQ
jgi:hypothetical protein